MLGERSAEFSANLPDLYGRPRKGYVFQKREACLMAMSYSYDIQAKVYDRMTELEAKQAHDPSLLLSDPVVLQNLLLTNVTARIAAEKRADQVQQDVVRLRPINAVVIRLHASRRRFRIQKVILAG